MCSAAQRTKRFPVSRLVDKFLCRSPTKRRLEVRENKWLQEKILNASGVKADRTHGWTTGWIRVCLVLKTKKLKYPCFFKKNWESWVHLMKWSKLNNDCSRKRKLRTRENQLAKLGLKTYFSRWVKDRCDYNRWSKKPYSDLIW